MMKSHQLHHGVPSTPVSLSHEHLTNSSHYSLNSQHFTLLTQDKRQLQDVEV